MFLPFGRTGRTRSPRAIIEAAGPVEPALMTRIDGLGLRGA